MLSILPRTTITSTCIYWIYDAWEHEAAHIAHVPNKPLDYLNDWMGDLEPEQTYYIHCAGGYRSMIAAFILKARGYDHVIDIAGGYGAISKTDLPKESGLLVNN
jgi:rhodanese-related sulfurtransferase